MPSKSGHAVITWSSLAFSLAVFSCAAPPAGAPGPESQSPDIIRERSMAAPPEALAASYLGNEYVLFFVSAIRTHENVTVRTTLNGRDVAINRSNFDKYEKLLTERHAIFASVIEGRGYQSFAGTYTAHANQACGDARAPAVLPNINELAQKSSPTPGTLETITQEGFRLSMVNTAVPGKSTETLKSPGVAIEKMLVLQDGLSPDFTYAGTLSGRNIVIRPMTAAIRHHVQAYPAGAFRAPDWAALDKCVITLTPATAQRR